MTKYEHWEKSFKDMHSKYDIRCDHFSMYHADNYAECKDCLVKSTCRSLGGLFGEICNQYGSEDCDNDCETECPVLNEICQLESSDDDPIPVTMEDAKKAAVELNKHRRRRKMFQFGDKK